MSVITNPSSGGGGGMAIGGSVTSGTQGSVLFIGAGGVLAQDNANFFWDDTNYILKLGATNGSAALYIDNIPAVYRVPNGSGDNWFEAGAGNTTVSGSNNFGTGTNSLTNITTSVSNTAIGANCLSLLVDNGDNIAIGGLILNQGAHLSGNIGVGFNLFGSLGYFGTTETNNVAVGSTIVGSAYTNVHDNTMIGSQIAYFTSSTALYYNVCIGPQVAKNISGAINYSTLVGNAVLQDATSIVQSTVIGGWVGPSSVPISNIIALADGSNPTNPQVDWNYTTANVWTFQYPIAVPGGTNPVISTISPVTSGAGASVGTLTNAPSAGNPTSWIPINDNGTTRYIPAW